MTTYQQKESMPVENPEIDPRGAEYLSLLGFGDIIDQPINVGEKTLLAKDFLQFCAQHAVPAFEYFKTLEPGSVEYEQNKVSLKKMVSIFMDNSESKD